VGRRSDRDLTAGVQGGGTAAGVLDVGAVSAIVQCLGDCLHVDAGGLPTGVERLPQLGEQVRVDLLGQSGASPLAGRSPQLVVRGQ